MLTLYHCMSARSFRPLWMLEELQAPYTLKMLPFPPRALERSYLSVNVLGTVPFLEGDGVAMTESAAMCQYLAETLDAANARGLHVKPGEPDYPAYLNWLHHGEATLTFPQTIALRYGRFEPPERRIPQAADDYTKWFLARLRAIDALLARQDFLCAGRFTGADVSVGYALMLGGFLGLVERFPPAIQAYWARLQLRDGFVRALAAQEAAAKAQGVVTRSAAQG
jgi:glutathione S-transferase